MTGAVIDTARLTRGFADPVFDAQAAFRAILNAMAYPGRMVELPARHEAPAPLEAATAAIALALIDFETPLWLDAGAGGAADYLRFHCGAPIAPVPEAARFAIITDPVVMPPLSAFAAGDDLYPDRSATLIIQLPALEGGTPMRWSGPGIRDTATLAPRGLPDRFLSEWADNHALYPIGVDILFTAGVYAIGLPRSIRMEG